MRGCRKYSRGVKYFHSVVPVSPHGEIAGHGSSQTETNATLLESLIARQIAASEAGATAQRITNAALHPHARSRCNRASKHGRPQNALNLATTYHQTHEHRENERLSKIKSSPSTPSPLPSPPLLHQSSRAAEQQRVTGGGGHRPKPPCLQQPFLRQHCSLLQTRTEAVLRPCVLCPCLRPFVRMSLIGRFDRSDLIDIILNNIDLIDSLLNISI